MPRPNERDLTCILLFKCGTSTCIRSYNVWVTHQRHFPGSKLGIKCWDIPKRDEAKPPTLAEIEVFDNALRLTLSLLITSRPKHSRHACLLEGAVIRLIKIAKLVPMTSHSWLCSHRTGPMSLIYQAMKMASRSSQQSLLAMQRKSHDRPRHRCQQCPLPQAPELVQMQISQQRH